jgi:hypothetical protein
MEVTLDAIDWSKLTAFQPLSKYFDEYLFEIEEYPEWLLSGPEHGWESDSANQYFQVARILEQVKQHVDEKTLKLIDEGITPLISENSQLDELGTKPITEDTNWISITPETTKKIYAALKQIDLSYLADTVRKHPTSDSEDIMSSLDEDFIGFIKQHLTMVEKAVERGYGLLGHIG